MLQNEVCDLLGNDIKAYAVDYLRRCEENRMLSLYNYRYYKDELNRKKEYGLNHLADSTVDRINNYTINLKESIQHKLPHPEFHRFVYINGDTTYLPKGRVTLQRLQALKTKNEQLEKAIVQNKNQLVELDSLATAYGSQLNALHELWKQYEIDSRNFDLYVFYMKTRLESLNTKSVSGAQPREK